MQAYNGQPTESKPAPFELTPYSPVVRKHLPEWVTNGLAAIKPWTWSLGARLGRTWHRNRGGYVHGEHVKERWAREAQCAQDVARLNARNWYRLCEQLPGEHRYRFRAVLLQARRLYTGGEWWKERSYIDHSTGEVKQTVYLPEDAWSAQTALAWCVRWLEHFHALARGMAESMTPRSRPRESQIVERRAPSALKDDPALSALIARGNRRFGVQPELPATS